MGFIAPNYTQIPNELLDKHMAEMKGSELKVILFILRKTLGFVDENGNRKTSDRISYSQIENGTRLGRHQICDALNSLENNFKLIKSHKKNRAVTSYSIIFESGGAEMAPQLVPKQQQGSAKTAPDLVPKQHLQKKQRNLSKEIKKDEPFISLPDIEYVKLTQTEYDDLKSKYGGGVIGDMIIQLDSWLAEGNFKRCHKKTIIAWLVKRGVRQIQKPLTAKEQEERNKKEYEKFQAEQARKRKEIAERQAQEQGEANVM